jgi:hypothetical protein
LDPLAGAHHKRAGAKIAKIEVAERGKGLKPGTPRNRLNWRFDAVSQLLFKRTHFAIIA